MIEEIVGAVLIRPETNSVFLVKEHNYRWGFPKGHRKHNETYDEAANRHIYKQSGINNNQNIYLGTIVGDDVVCTMTHDEQLYLIDDQTKLGTAFYHQPKSEIHKIKYYLIYSANKNVIAKMNEDALIAMQWAPLNDALQMVTDNIEKKIILSLINKINS